MFTDGAPNCIVGNFGGAPVQPASLYSLAVRTTPTWIYSFDQPDNFLGTYGGITIPSNTDHTNTINLQSDNNPRTRVLDTDSGGIINTKCNVNKAARNMLENVANAARREDPNVNGSPINVFTIGFGLAMTTQEVSECYGTDNKELGAYILRRLANVPGVDTYNSDQPTGLYVQADDATELDSAFERVANAILRLSK